ncbi:MULTISPECIES: SNF2-related protein [Mycolicibacterium]|uniref:SNF2 domain-containing protein n=1 Tax=Mycolicibacterium senegalense TaxID=1796 RepID=A0A378W6S4_9MYCO|nr:MULTISPECIES: DEAD/DEAH box helicase [Mycolicibacterium]MCV7335543.1 DEAD/DEAH box helicase [Mycolicibacterium senegalense]MDR7288606.1 superfamily II DNA or RNA helicase [Mycolicibacterium senegalense]QZA25529.1 DEAD/DEAH box helicase [Mycolicibacterium senegalense]CDP85307.1 SNF2 domain-containing protein [Mycolicibacterium farcinogenes]SUA27820.1 SNF2 domain-containing protein [Mycolicibacterium senegalense]
MDSADSTELIRHAEAALAGVGKLRAEIADRIRASTDEVVTQTLKSAPLPHLRPYLARGARLGGLANSDYRTVADVHSVPARLLTQVPGVDIEAAQAVQAAAQAMADHLRTTTRPRLRPGEDTELLSSLLTLAEADLPVKQLRRLMPRLRSNTASDQLLNSARGLLDRIDDARHRQGDPWVSYRADPRPIDQLLTEFASGTTDIDAAQGFIGAEVAALVEQTVLNRTLLRTELRGYQDFGARYALARERVLLCDDLGLGKTLQALAVAAHLAAAQLRHTLVVCQPNTGIHWAAETAKHTALRAIEIRGSERDARLENWKAAGGVAIVSYDTLQRIKLPERPGLVIVDEAHLLRDPKSDRARAVRNVLSTDNRVLFLSGVPMHQRVGGFRHLADFLQPEVAGKVAPNAGDRGSIAFRRAVDRVYLRRDYRDVVDELPARISTEEWVRPSRADRERYRQAVSSGNFSAIRQAAWPSGSPTPAAKLDRLIELVNEAHINGARVVVFSHFPAVLDVIRKALPGNIFGPVDESVPDRQAVVDAFATDRGPATLLADIGVGALDLRRLNAPVVFIIAEPQWQPRTERRIVGRTQRLSELHTVRVYRLLARATVDEPIRRLAQHPDQAPPHQDEVVRAEQARLARAGLTAKFSGTG